MRLPQPGLAVSTTCLCCGRRPGVARHASNFLSRRRKKVTKERATPLFASPALRAGATCGARGRCAAELAALRCSSAQTAAASQFTMRVCPSAHAPPRPLRSSAHTEGMGHGHPFGPLLRSAPSRGRTRLALGATAGAWRGACQVERSDDPCGCSAVRLFGCSAVLLFGCSAVRLFGCSAVRLFGTLPLLAAPAPGRLRGGSRASARLLRDLTRRGCPSGAAQQQSEFRGAPRNRHGAGLPLRSAKGSQTEGRLFFAYFLLAKQKKVSRKPGDSRLPP